MLGPEVATQGAATAGWPENGAGRRRDRAGLKGLERLPTLPRRTETGKGGLGTTVTTSNEPEAAGPPP